MLALSRNDWAAAADVVHGGQETRDYAAKFPRHAKKSEMLAYFDAYGRFSSPTCAVDLLTFAGDSEAHRARVNLALKQKMVDAMECGADGHCWTSEMLSSVFGILSK